MATPSRHRDLNIFRIFFWSLRLYYVVALSLSQSYTIVAWPALILINSDGLSLCTQAVVLSGWRISLGCCWVISGRLTGSSQISSGPIRWAFRSANQWCGSRRIGNFIGRLHIQFRTKRIRTFCMAEIPIEFRAGSTVLARIRKLLAEWRSSFRQKRLDSNLTQLTGLIDKD